MKKKIKVSLGDLREVWYMMECPCDFKEFVESYREDKNYEVVNSFVCVYAFDDTSIDDDEDYEDDIDRRLDENNL